MNESIINNFRPKKIEDMIICDTIKDIINGYINGKNINHIIFIGNSETGKTTISNILYKSIDHSIFINNINAKGINTFRTDIKLYCQLTLKRKTIIIDDIDHINDSCQCIMKSLIDKYKNTLFIGTINNVKKLIEPLKSSVLLIKLQDINNDLLSKLLNNVLIKQNLILDKKTKEYLIQISNFSINKLYNYIEKIILFNGGVYHYKFKNILTNITYDSFDDIMKYAKNNKIHNIIKTFYDLYEKGYSIIDIFEFFYNYIKITVEVEDVIKYKIIKLICEYISTLDSINEQEAELYLFSYELNYIFLDCK